MSKRVLSIGQCAMDHGSIAALVAREFRAEIVAADSLAEARNALADGPFELVLVNRRLDADGDDGLEVIRALKESPGGDRSPMMLVSNFPEFQTKAVALGAEMGFGKNALGSPATRERLAKFLS